jgi:predicted ATPase
MAHITGLSLGNFKVFKEKMDFEFSPITILTGGNNVGKSSVLKALLLIADNAKKTQFLELDFSGDRHNLDTFDYTINKRADNDVIEIGFELSQPNQFGFEDHKNFRLNLSYEKSENVCNVIAYIIIRNNNEELFAVRLDKENKHTFHVNIKGYQDIKNDIDFVNEPFLDKLLQNIPKLEIEEIKRSIGKELVEYLSVLEINSSDWNYWQSTDEFNTASNSFEDATYSDLVRVFLDANIFSGEQKRLLKKIDNLPTIKTLLESYNIDTNLTIQDILSPSQSDIFYKFEDFLRNIHKSISTIIELDFISNFRANSKRLYSNQHQGTDFNELLLEIHKTKFSGTKGFIKDWLKAFGIGDDIHFKWFKGVATEVKIEKNGELIDLVDLGFGITQLLPIILKIALIVENRKYFRSAESYLDRSIQKNQFIFNSDGSIKIKNLSNDYNKILEDDEQFKNKTFKRNELFDYHVILLEEPETNLHPNLQSKLADFLLDASKRFNIQFIIETHSEYLIRKLQYLVATKETYPKDIALYYFNDPENIPQGEEQVKKIEFLEDGNLSDNFGNGFFNEADNLAIDLFNLNRKRHRANV